MEGLPFSDLRLLRRNGAVEVLSGKSRSGERVVIKRLGAGLAARDPVGVQRFRREQAIASALDHPGVAARHACGEDWLAVEWLETSLEDQPRQRQFSTPAALQGLLADLAGTLAYLHARGIAHADLKPAHVRFRGERPVLIDFGIAAVGSQDPLSQEELAGSPRWMAPELIAGEPPSPPADIWSLCAITAWLSNGAPASADDAETMLERRRGGAELPEHDLAALGQADPGLQAVVAAGLSPARLRPTAAALVHLISRSTAG